MITLLKPLPWSLLLFVAVLGMVLAERGGVDGMAGLVLKGTVVAVAVAAFLVWLDDRFFGFRE
ncbi:MAG: hypothetical protein ACFBZ8_02285 [Opitutales bacterium]